MQTVFSVLIIAQFLVVILHDLIEIPGWVHGHQVREVIGRSKLYIATAVNAIFPAVAVILAVRFWSGPKPSYVYRYWTIYCAITVISAVAMWYVPYLFGTDKQTCSQYEAMYRGTRHILPRRGENPRPNLFHIMLHVLFLATLIIAVTLMLGHRQ